MRIQTVADGAALARAAADLICAAVASKPGAILGLPTGNTPIATYGELARCVRAGACDFSRVTVYAIDEFCDATRTTPGTNSAFYREHLRIGARALHCPNPAAKDPGEHMSAFADAIRRSGGFDLCVLGVGVNGHIAFNEPGSSADSRARVVELTDTSRRAHAATFGSLEAVPARGMTLGIADLLESRAIVVLAQGAPKAAVVRRAIEGPATADVPASWLRSHADVVWLVDAVAGSLVEPSP
jgi:glucosamine-6-phosphate deaminase